MAHRVVFAPEAQADLIELYDYLAEHAGLDVDRILYGAVISGPP